MNHTRTTGPIVIVVVAVAILSGTYVGTYYATVDPGGFGICESYPKLHGRFDGRPSEEQRQSFLWWTRFFRPIHRIDRRIRTRVWDQGL